MSKANSGLFAGSEGARIEVPRHSSLMATQQVSSKRGDGGFKSVSPSEIRYSQTSVNGSQEIIDSMKKNGWVGNPIDVVVMDDGEMTTLDNTRVIAARAAGIDVKANIHGYREPLPNQASKDRFSTSKGGEPQTWGQAVENRIGKQPRGFRRNNPWGSYNMEKIK